MNPELQPRDISIPPIFFTRIQAELKSGPAWAVVMTAAWWTYCFRPNNENLWPISLSTFQTYTGMARTTVERALKKAVAYGILQRRHSKRNGKKQTDTYRINMSWGVVAESYHSGNFSGSSPLPPYGSGELPDRDLRSLEGCGAPPPHLDPYSQILHDQGIQLHSKDNLDQRMLAAKPPLKEVLRWCTTAKKKDNPAGWVSRCFKNWKDKHKDSTPPGSTTVPVVKEEKIDSIQIDATAYLDTINLKIPAALLLVRDYSHTPEMKALKTKSQLHQFIDVHIIPKVTS